MTNASAQNRFRLIVLSVMLTLVSVCGQLSLMHAETKPSKGLLFFYRTVNLASYYLPDSIANGLPDRPYMYA